MQEKFTYFPDTLRTLVGYATVWLRVSVTAPVLACIYKRLLTERNCL